MSTDGIYEFDLIFALPSPADIDSILDRLYDAGCDDAVIGVGAPDMIGLGFTRYGPDAETVISRTLNQILIALPEGCRLREVKPDLVSLAEVAARLGVTRQALQKREMPAPSLGGLYRATEIRPHLSQATGKIAEALATADPWFAAAAGAQRVNARISLGDIPACRHAHQTGTNAVVPQKNPVPARQAACPPFSASPTEIRRRKGSEAG
ncbi:hypothetical protein P7L75_09930 [Tistrella mobilis]|uniref:hypothetical protein n=1 Tax=Tistrella mobilis TaxID=171437 RepID=UPI003556012A